MTKARLSAIVGAVVAGVAISGGCGGGGGGGSEPPFAPPSAPAGLSAAPRSGAVWLTWTALPSVTSYHVYRGTSTGTLATKAVIASVPSPVGFYLDSAVTNGTAYYYQVTAANRAGESAGSSEVSATPAAAPPPAAPTAAASAGNGYVMIAWSTVSTATSYNLYWSTTAGVTPTSGTKVPFIGSPYTHSGLTNGTTYYYVVTAENANGESAASGQVSATPLASVGPYIWGTVLTWVPAAPTKVPVLEVQVCTDPSCTTPITNATVSVNGAPLTHVASGDYQASGPMPAAGAAVNLSVTVPGSGTYTTSGTQYTTFPTMTAPGSGAIWQGAGANTVTWTAGVPANTTPASEYIVGVRNNTTGTFYPANSRGLPAETAIGNSSYSVVGLPAGAYTVFVGIATAGLSTGGIPISGAAPGSGLLIGGFSGVVPITVQ